MKFTTIILLGLSIYPLSNGFADIVFNDASFNGSLTSMGGDTFTEADSGVYDAWIFFDDGANKEWSIQTGGPTGATDNYASGAFSGNNYNRTIFQAVTDSKSNTGTLNLSFDFNLSDGGADNGPVTVSVWGVENIGGATFSLSGRSQAGVTSGDATILATQSYTADTAGWVSEGISNIDFGTGYDLVIFGVWSAQHDSGDPDTVGIDNVSITAVPEPSSFVLIGLAGLSALAIKRKRNKS